MNKHVVRRVVATLVVQIVLAACAAALYATQTPSEVCAASPRRCVD